jgi:hypothetical protein
LDDERKRKEADPKLEELKGLTMSDGNYEILINEWKDIVAKEKGLEKEQKNFNESKKQLKLTIDERQNEFKDLEQKCNILEKKIRELQRTKIMQEQQIKRKKAEMEANLVEEEWDSRFDPSRTGSRQKIVEKRTIVLKEPSHSVRKSDSEPKVLLNLHFFKNRWLPCRKIQNRSTKRTPRSQT